MTLATNVVETHSYHVPVLERGTGSPLVYLHSYEGPLAADSAFFSSVAAERHVVAPTHPGFAGTEAHPDIATIPNVVVLYLELLDKLGLEQVDLVGHSLGAMFAAEVAAVAPQRVRKLVLVAPLGIWSEAHPTPDVLASGGPALLRMTWADPASEAAVEMSKAPMIERTANVAAAGNYLWPLPDRGLEARIHRLSMPTLLVRGEKDGVVSDGLLAEFARRIPGSTVRTIESAGHFPMLEQPADFARAVQEFLAG